MQAVTERQATAVARGPAGVRLPSLLSDRRARVSRMVFRIPLWLYRLRLGWVLGHEFLVLTHVGRRTGRVHETLLKVLRYDPATGESIVASAWGVQTDWYRNIQAHPAVALQIARARSRRASGWSHRTKRSWCSGSGFTASVGLRG